MVVMFAVERSLSGQGVKNNMDSHLRETQAFATPSPSLDDARMPYLPIAFVAFLAVSPVLPRSFSVQTRMLWIVLFMKRRG
jgi:hypothetical protein